MLVQVLPCLTRVPLFPRSLRWDLLVLIHFFGVDNAEYFLASSELIRAGDRVQRRHARAERIQGLACCRILRTTSTSLLLEFRSRHRVLGLLLPNTPHSSTIFMIGCTSQITGIRLFKLGGPGWGPCACVISKNNDPSICTGTG